MSALKREVRFRPAYHRIEEGQGVHGVECLFILRVEPDALVLRAATNWMLEKTYVWWEEQGMSRFSLRFPTMGVHLHRPPREGEMPTSPACEILNGPCVSRSLYSAYREEAIFDLLVAGGDEPFWHEMEVVYREMRAEDA
jgi:hypothetical protein